MSKLQHLKAFKRVENLITETVHVLKKEHGRFLTTDKFSRIVNEELQIPVINYQQLGYHGSETVNEKFIKDITRHICEGFVEFGKAIPGALATGAAGAALGYGLDKTAGTAIQYGLGMKPYGFTRELDRDLMYGAGWYGADEAIARYKNYKNSLGRGRFGPPNTTPGGSWLGSLLGPLSGHALKDLAPGIGRGILPQIGTQTAAYMAGKAMEPWVNKQLASGWRGFVDKGWNPMVDKLTSGNVGQDALRRLSQTGVGGPHVETQVVPPPAGSRIRPKFEYKFRPEGTLSKSGKWIAGTAAVLAALGLSNVAFGDQPQQTPETPQEPQTLAPEAPKQSAPVRGEYMTIQDRDAGKRMGELLNTYRDQLGPENTQTTIDRLKAELGRSYSLNESVLLQVLLEGGVNLEPAVESIWRELVQSGIITGERAGAESITRTGGEAATRSAEQAATHALPNKSSWIRTLFGDSLGDWWEGSARSGESSVPQSSKSATPEAPTPEIPNPENHGVPGEETSTGAIPVRTPIGRSAGEAAGSLERTPARTGEGMGKTRGEKGSATERVEKPHEGEGSGEGTGKPKVRSRMPEESLTPGLVFSKPDITRAEGGFEYAPNEILDANKATAAWDLQGNRFPVSTKSRRPMMENTDLNENKLSEKESATRKAEKQKYRVVYMQDGKKVEVFASSIRGVRRVVYNKSQFRIYDSKGSDVTGYVKRMLNQDDKK